VRALWTFKAEQKRFEIGNVDIGGLPGANPTVLIGSIFHHGHRILKDEATGDFNREAAEECINIQEEFSDKTGNPHMLDVIGSTGEAFEKLLDFVSSVTDSPILLDGATASVRAAGLRYVKESGLRNPIVYNTLTPDCKKDEIEEIRKSNVKSAVLLAYNLKDFTSEGRVKAIRELLPVAYSAGIEKPLIDTCVMDLPTLGQACEAIFKTKSELGLPVGCGAHNAVALWKGLKGKMGDQAVKPCLASAAAAAAAIGADFVLYGPIEDAKYVFPAVAMVNVAQSQVWVERGVKIDPNHPRYKVG